MTKTCVQCGKEKDELKFPASYDDNRKNRCRACYGKRERMKMKRDMLDALGWKCNCCSESHPLFLTLDHVQNDGARHREKYNEQQIYREARREGWPKEKYQVLCINCNFAKGHFDECPHKSGLTKEESAAMINEMATGDGTRYRRWWKRPTEEK